MRNDTFYGVQFAQSVYELKQKAVLDSKLTVNNSTTQYIEQGVDENHAIGHWTTIFYDFDNTDVGSNIYLVIGIYENEFVLENHIWKLQKSNWKECYKCGPWKVGEDNKLSSYLKAPEAWVPEIPELVSLENLEVSSRTMEILALRNDILGSFTSFNNGRDLSWVDALCTEEVAGEARELLSKVETLLVTSPVLKMSDDLKKVEAFFSMNVLSKYGENQIVSTRGSLRLLLEKRKSGWKVYDLSWYDYISLEPWEIA